MGGVLRGILILATSRSHNYGKNESEFALPIKENVWNV
jgi:hypothetical protein